MRRISRAVERHQEYYGRVLAAWANDGQTHATQRGEVAQYLDNLTVTQSAVSLIRGSTEVDLFDHNQWIIGRAVRTREGTLFPVVSAAFMIEGAYLVGTIRTALFYGDGAGNVRASGLRFESAESLYGSNGQTNPHTYPHAQPINSWSISGVCLLHPDAVGDEEVSGCPDCYVESGEGRIRRTEHFNGHRPAVPLRCRTLPGLALTAIASIHGSEIARQILEPDLHFLASGCPDSIFHDFEHILGEDQAAQFSA